MSERRAVYTVRDRGEGKKAFWVRIGTCFTNRDGSFSVLLDALPLDGKLVIREEQERDDAGPPRRSEDRGNGGGSRRGAQRNFGGGDDEIPFVVDETTR